VVIPVRERPLTGSYNVELPDADVANRLKWLLVVRFVIICVLVASSLVVRASTDEALFATAALALYGVAAAAFTSIAIGAVVLRFWPSAIVGIAYFQLFADALIASALVALTGGADSVFAFIFSLSVLNAAIVLDRRAALVLAAGSFLLFAGTAFATAHDPWPKLLPTVLTNGASLFLVAVLSGYLTTQLTTTSANLEVARAQIVKLEELYAAVLSSLPSGVMSVNAAGEIVYVNAAGRDILGVKDVVGHAVHDIAPVLEPAMGRGESARFEVDAELEGRGLRVLGGSVAPLVGINETGRVVIFQDLTELRRLQDDMARAERLAQLGRLAAGLAHEVRNPLAAMIGCLQMLTTTDALTGDNARLLSIVHREAERLSGLVQAFLTYARPAEPIPSAVSLRSLLDETTTAARHGLKSATLTASSSDVIVRVDAGQLRQVLWNVITNADRMLESIDKQGTIAVSIEVDNEAATIFVDDDGPGVPEELRQQIFEPFFTTRANGNGLGLATCQMLIRQNGGAIGAHRSPQLGGARFAIRLPLDVSHNDA
jgi:two-component system sensor histidine kinase PilS (NtrC family)